MSATEELRALLDERGVFWEKGVGGITTCVGDWCFVEYPNGKLAATCEPALTPQQAIAATLGSELMSMRTFDSMETALSIAEKEVEIEELRRENDELCKENEELVHRRAELESATHGTLTAEQVREAIERHVKFYEGGDYDEQAIADELNAELGNGTCEWVLEHSGTLFDKWRCSECGYLFVEPRCVQGYNDIDPNFCMKCGKAVKR